MIVYIPTPITSVEQAERLPLGTIAVESEHQALAEAEHHGPGAPAIRCRHYEPSCTWFSDYEGSMPAGRVVGWTALVPIEAEEETTEQIQVYRGVAHIGPSSVTPAPSRRLVTPWTTKEEA